MSKKAKRAVEDRFWRRVNKKGRLMPGMFSRCWEWQGSLLQDGYGQFNIPVGDERKNKMPHNYAWLRAGGQLPPRGFMLHHLCHNTACVNPSHLAMVTRVGRSRLQNVILVAKCKHGHLLDKENIYVRPNGKVDCRICAGRSRKNYNERRRGASIALQRTKQYG